MKYLFATPLRSLMLLLVWVALNNSVAPIILVSGLLLGLLIPLLTPHFREPQPSLRRFGLAVFYFGRLMLDIVIANLQMVKLILGPNRKLRPAFVMMPLDLTGSLPLTILASTICLTPGTVSADLLPHNSKQPRFLLLHVLDLDDEAALIALLKQRYEQPLKEIFP